MDEDCAPKGYNWATSTPSFQAGTTMPGRLRSSFRSGNIAEHLGILLLKGIAAVGEVARQEDIGIDAVGTLLRDDVDGNRYAEDTFAVQLKSESTRAIEYSDHEIQWLVGQALPMFVGLVSLDRALISLYSTIHVNHAVLALIPKRIAIQFGQSGLPPFFAGQKWGPWTGGSDDSATVWLGDPVVSWTIGDLSDKEKTRNVYHVLKRFLQFARRERELLYFDQSSILQMTPIQSLRVLV